MNVSIQGAQILRGLSFEIASGEAVALIGRNGAGKTTTLRTIMGFVKPTTGAVDLDGRRVDEDKPHLRAGLGLGYAPEDRRLFSAFDVENNLLLPARVQKLGRAIVEARLQQVYELLPELADLKRRPAGSVSGGQGKMVALGRALMTGTKLVLLDEPFQGLAPVLARRYADALKRLRDIDSNLAVLVTESNPELLENYADRMLEMERGEVTPKAIPKAGSH